jgi:hypothetical protein
MPKVHRNSIALKGEGGELVEFLRVIDYDAHAKRFSVRLPEWWSKVLGYHGDPHNIAFAEGTALDIWFNVGYETTSKFEKFNTYTDLEMARLGDSRNSNLHVMDWTAERQEFFVAFKLELTKMIYKLDRFLNGSSQRMAELIDRFKSVPALPFPEEGKKGDGKVNG